MEILISRIKMKVTLEFSLPEEREEYEMYANAAKYYAVIWEYLSTLRSHIKYGSEEEKGSFEEAREMFWNIISEQDLGKEF